MRMCYSSWLTKKAEPRRNCDMANPDLVERTDSDTSRWLRRLVRHQSHKTQ
jgi:hypothetical protein